MEQKTINKNKLITILCIIAFTLGVLVSAVLFSMPPVHAEESVNGTEIFKYTNIATGSYTQTITYYISDSCEYYNFILGDPVNNWRGGIAIVNPSPNVSSQSSWVTAFDNGNVNSSILNNSYISFTLSNGLNINWYGIVPSLNMKHDIDGHYYLFTSGYDFSTNDGVKSFLEHYFVDKDIKADQEVNAPNLTDEAYTFTGFSINGKTARWTGTTERSYLKDQEVEEYTTITYAWATTTEPDNIGSFQEYDGEFPTSAKQLKLPWSDMESGKVDFQFIRQVNITPCYRVPGAFYHGQAVKIFFKPDGSIEKISDPNVYGVLDESIPIPILSVDNDQGTFLFTNAQNDYKFELKGRFWSTDDFYVYRNTPSPVWQYKYLTLLKNSLTTWVSVGDNKSVLDTFSFGDLGSESWQDLLNTYPIDQRNIITGQEQGWFSWANITGYNDAVSTLKMLLNSPYSLFNGYEIYVRYYVIDSDGTVKYSKWTHYFNNLANADGSTGSIVDDAGNMNNGSQSDKGLTDNDLNNVENSGNSRNDVDAKPSSDFGSVDIGDISGIFNQFLNVLKGLYSGMGQLPSFINAIFGFLPAWVTTMIGVSIVIIIFLRILGR